MPREYVTTPAHKRVLARVERDGDCLLFTGTPRENVLRGDRPAQMAEENRDPSRRRGARRWR